MKRLLIGLGIASSIFFASLASAKTLMLEGKLNSSIAMSQNMDFSTNQGTVQSFVFKFALPAEFHTKSVSQSVSDQRLVIKPNPSTSKVETDKFGNHYQHVTWNNVDTDISISLQYTANVQSVLSAMESRTPFPIGKVSAADAAFLKPTELVQSNSPAIAALARKLTADAQNEYEAVTAITNHVADIIKYTFNPPQYDASYTLETKSGNCQNFAHLSIALLRNVGIPARIVGGITLKDTWKVPVDNRNSIVQGMGQGGHAWMEIYFPDLGWLPYDPQQSRQFTSSRHIKQTHGLDSRDINDTWRGSPYLPQYSERIDGIFKNDDIKLKVKSYGKDPRPYIISNLVSAKTVALPDEADLAAEALEKTRIDAQKKADKERLARELAERDRAAKEKIERERLKKERLEAERLAKLKAEEERNAIQKVEKDRLAKERMEADRLAKLKALEERRAYEQAEKARITREKQEKERLAKEKISKERLAKEKHERELVAAKKLKEREQLEKARIARLKEREAEEKARVADLKKIKPLKPGTPLLFGNMEFPSLVNSYNVKGNTGTRILDKETSEYVTSKYIYSQAFVVKNQMSLDKVSLAMRKFGGDGSVYVDIVQDDGGKPGLPGKVDGIRSNFIDLEKVSKKPGYYWIDFSLPSKFSMKPGKYWIVFRASGEAIMNWFFIPGKPYSDGDDTRSTAKGYEWEDILNYDFVFKVAGKAL